MLYRNNLFDNEIILASKSLIVMGDFFYKIQISLNVCIIFIEKFYTYKEISIVQDKIFD